VYSVVLLNSVTLGAWCYLYAPVSHGLSPTIPLDFAPRKPFLGKTFCRQTPHQDAMPIKSHPLQ